MNKRKIRIAVVRREPIDLDRLALAILALLQQLSDGGGTAAENPAEPDEEDTDS